MDGWIGVLGLMAMLCMRVAFSFSGLVWPGSCCGLGLIGKDRPSYTGSPTICNFSFDIKFKLRF